MDYNHITSFLSKLKNTLESSDLKYVIVQDAILKFTKKNIAKKDLKIKAGTLFISGSPMMKNEIFMNKNKILEYIKENNLSIIDIK